MQSSHGFARYKRGFTLIEMLVVVALIAIIYTILFLLINPPELITRARDVSRLSDLASIRTAINSVLQDGVPNIAGVLCYNLTVPCFANSNDASPNIRNSNGSGWVKVNFSSYSSTTVPTLPVDPTNVSIYHYSYYSNGSLYELDARLESEKYKYKMVTDGGDNPNAYETGTGLTLIN